MGGVRNGKSVAVAMLVKQLLESEEMQMRKALHMEIEKLRKE